MNEKHWCIKHADGTLNTGGIFSEKEEAEMDWGLGDQPAVEVEIVEKGKHPDTVTLERIVKEVFNDSPCLLNKIEMLLYNDRTIRQAIDEAITMKTDEIPEDKEWDTPAPPSRIIKGYC